MGDLMHPFLPILSLVLLFMGDALAFFLHRFGRDADVALHRPSLWTLIFVSLLFGGGLAFWLRRFRLRFPFYAALLSLAWVVLLAVI
jgi:hypothetical protein